MSPTQSRHSSGLSEDDLHSVLNERKQKRILSNRESARRSRLKKQKHLDDLINQVSTLQTQNSEMITRTNAGVQHFVKLHQENAVLRNQVMELTQRLQYLNSILRALEAYSGIALDIPEIPDPLLSPWKLPCPSQPIMASANILRF